MGVFQLDISSAGSGSSGSSYIFFGVFVAGEVDGGGDKWSGYTTMVDGHICLKPL
jgi:hypothetical protein